MDRKNLEKEVFLPGKLGNPKMQIEDDPRLDPRLLAALRNYGLLEQGGPLPVSVNSSIPDLIDFCKQAEKGWEEENAKIYAYVKPNPEVALKTVVIRGVDDNEIKLFIHRPKSADSNLPGILYLHGGGMVMLSTTGPIYQQWRDDLALSGLVTVGVEFRNAGGKLGPHPFPAGLNDCFSALSWMHKNKSFLKVSGIILSGESGGGNLAIATCLKAKEVNLLTHVQGVYAQAPILANAYIDKDPTIQSLFECDGYAGMDLALVAALTKLYDPQETYASDPFAWPLHANQDLLKDLPPHYISVNELDPHRDEGIAYVRKLLDAG
ncbi:MAG: alpha/beta hydrolase fold domain-containing protein [Candidatus Azotimanducaceae bacterium]